MSTRYFYRVEYGAGDTKGIVAYLTAHPDELPDYQAATIKTIIGMMAWGEYRTPPEAFALMCSIIAAVRLARGESVIAFDDPSPSPWHTLEV